MEKLSDTDQRAESMGWGSWGGVASPLPPAKGSGECCKLPIGVRGGSPAAEGRFPRTLQSVSSFSAIGQALIITETGSRNNGETLSKFQARISECSGMDLWSPNYSRWMHEISAPTLSETGTKLRRRRSPHAYDNPKIFSLYFHILYRYPNGMSACNWRRKAAVLEPLACWLNTENILESSSHVNCLPCPTCMLMNTAANDQV